MSNFLGDQFCGCKDCRSLLSPAAYLVDIMKFLSVNNQKTGKIPLDELLARRPDLEHIPLTCENTNTRIPYIDLVNEVMEFYVANDKPGSAAFDTGSATSPELRASPQSTIPEAYGKINDAVYPFSLPYHQPLDVIRLCLGHLQTSRSEVMESFHKKDLIDAISQIEIACEYLGISEEEFVILTEKQTGASKKEVWEYYGYPAQTTEVAFKAGITRMPELLKRTGVSYADLVEIIKTQFVNPFQSLLNYLQDLFFTSKIPAKELYAKLKDIRANKPIPAGDPVHLILSSYGITLEAFTDWVKNNFDNFRTITTIYEANSDCNLATTELKSIKDIYEDPDTGIDIQVFSRLQSFIRLQQKTGWSIHELDNIIFTLGETAVSESLVKKISCISRINKGIKLSLSQLSCFWGNIDTYGEKSLYTKFFLNKSIQKTDPFFAANNFGKYLSKTGKVTDHIPAILSAFRCTETDLDSILNEISLKKDNGNIEASIENLSIVYSYFTLAKALKIKIPELIALKKTFNVSPVREWDNSATTFTPGNPTDTFRFIRVVNEIKNSGLGVDKLCFIINGSSALTAKGLELPEAIIFSKAKTIRNALVQIESLHPESDLAGADEELLRKKLSILFAPVVTEQMIGTLKENLLYSIIVDKATEAEIPVELKNKLKFVTIKDKNGKEENRLQCEGVLTIPERDDLVKIAGVTQDFITAVEKIFSNPAEFITENFSHVYASSNIKIEDSIAKLLERETPPRTLDLNEKFKEFYRVYLPYLKKQLRRTSIFQEIALLLGLDEMTAAALIEEDVNLLQEWIYSPGLTAQYFTGDFAAIAGGRLREEQIHFDWAAEVPNSHTPANNFSARWEGWLSPDSTDAYSFFGNVKESDEMMRLFINDQLQFEKKSGDAHISVGTEPQKSLSLTAGLLYPIKVEYAEATSDASVHLYWRTENASKEIIPGINLFPKDEISRFIDRCQRYHRASLLINSLGLTAWEILHFKKNKANFDGLDFSIVTPLQWTGLIQYQQLKKVLAGTALNLPALFELATNANSVTGLDDIIKTIVNTTSWKKEYIDYFIKKHFGLTVDAFKNAQVLRRLSSVIFLANQTGVSVESLGRWSQLHASFADLEMMAQDIKNVVKAKYEDDDWLEVAKELSNKIRDNQKNALISYLIVHPKLLEWGVEDANSLFEYLLIDVQMTSCMDTTRIVQAIAAIQLFVARCLLGLESHVDNTGTETGISPDHIDTTRWEWMKYYRVWEANRKVFLYPENWLEPEWRDDKSPLFKDHIESYLLQNDITDRNVETAFKNYLITLNEVANLEVCGVYQDNTVLHVFARTHSLPHQYYYRINEITPREGKTHNQWSAWEKVTLDIRGVDNGSRSGVHLIPFVWKNRLFLFWPEFMEKTRSKAANAQKNVSDLFNSTAEQLEPDKYWEMKLAWSEYIEGKWTSKQVTTEFAELNESYPTDPAIDLSHTTFGQPADYRVMITQENDLVLIGVSFYDRVNLVAIPFQFTVVQNKFTSFLTGGKSSATLDSGGPYRINFTSFLREGNLNLKKINYFKSNPRHTILYSQQINDFENTLKYPFFYQDDRRIYYVEPVNDISYLTKVLKDPEVAGITHLLPKETMKKIVFTPATRNSQAVIVNI